MLVLLLIALALAVMASLGIGARSLSAARILQLLFAPDGSTEAVVLWDLRLPRTLLGLLVGAALGLAGALMQALTRNPLADPGLLGINAGAAFAVVAGLSLVGLDDAPLRLACALLGATLAAGLVYMLGGSAPARGQPLRLILAGIALSASLHAGTGIITLFDSAVFDSYRFWAVGALSGQTPGGALAILPLLLIGLLLGLPLGGRLNALALGDDLGRALGAQPGQVRLLAFVAIVLLCGAATAVAGPIGFLGLVVPHALRLLVGADWRWILALAPLAGADLLLLADTLGRRVALPGELEAGIVCALLGTPVLLILVIRSARRVRS
ncbi:iron ABC transporter permease [Pseudomonas oryzihabitans]|nr:iron ABC transporter permease [Pseudomonas psychrotolerans]